MIFFSRRNARSSATNAVSLIDHALLSERARSIGGEPAGESKPGASANGINASIPDGTGESVSSVSTASAFRADGDDGSGKSGPPSETPDDRPGFFLRRPVFSTVISLIITLVGALAITVLPIEQYPNLTPV